MRIYIIEDDISVISILEDIVERNNLGTVCGDSGEGVPELEAILAACPDLILIDLLMPEKDGIQIVRELKERGCQAKFIMISQVSSKELIAKAEKIVGLNSPLMELCLHFNVVFVLCNKAVEKICNKIKKLCGFKSL